MNKLPVLISVPHGGTDIPKEIADRVCITAKDKFEDGDAFTREIYGIKNEVLSYVEANIARAFVDLNRDVDDRPPKNPDGVVKSMTCFGKPIYHPDAELDDELTEALLKTYYNPYHKQIKNILNSPNEIQLMLDCHSMEAVGPMISPDRGKERPKICLGSNHGKSCSKEWVQKMAQSFRSAFDLKENEVVVDQPFAGGLITRTYGNKPIPCIQVEMNRNLYLSPPWFNPQTLMINPGRLNDLKNNFKITLELFFQSTFQN
jgi:N-formylglutamate deformylase